MSTLIVILFRIMSLITPQAALVLAKLIARLAIIFNVDSKRISEINIKHCFPKKTRSEQDQILFDSLTQTALLPIELAYLVHWPLEKLSARISSVEGEDLFHQAWSEGTGVLLLVPHFGCWEFMSLYLGGSYPISALYTPPNLPALEPSILKARQRQGAVLYPTTASGLRGLVRGMKSGHVVVLLPDQVPTIDSGSIMSEFFGRKALTMSLAKRVAKVGNPKIIMACAWRQMEVSGFSYKISFQLPAEGIGSEDSAVYARALNSSVQKIIEKDASQYQWAYKRFRRLGPEVEDIYRRQ